MIQDNLIFVNEKCAYISSRNGVDDNDDDDADDDDADDDDSNDNDDGRDVRNYIGQNVSGEKGVNAGINEFHQQYEAGDGGEGSIYTRIFPDRVVDEDESNNDRVVGEDDSNNDDVSSNHHSDTRDDGDHEDKDDECIDNDYEDDYEDD